MRVIVSVLLPDGRVEDRMPTEEEMQRMAERYAQALLLAALPGAKVTIRRSQSLARMAQHVL